MMNISLQENIRAARRERKLTQEQLAEAMGVTVGAVSKWESGASVPELTMLAGLADYFGCSVDALLGYQIRGAGAEEMAGIIEQAYRSRDYENGRREAEKALLRYPNHFQVVWNSAVFYHMMGTAQWLTKPELLHRAIELYERACGLLTQNNDPVIHEIFIRNEIASIYMVLGEREKGVETLKRNNAGGVNNSLIGSALIQMGQYEEGAEYLSKALIQMGSEMLRTVGGLANYYGNRYGGREVTGEDGELLQWAVDVMKSARLPEGSSYLDKLIAAHLSCVASVDAYRGDEAAAKAHLEEAYRTACRFDADPCYEVSKIRFYHGEPKFGEDDLGSTAQEGILKQIHAQDGPHRAILERLWREVVQEASA